MLCLTWGICIWIELSIVYHISPGTGCICDTPQITENCIPSQFQKNVKCTTILSLNESIGFTVVVDEQRRFQIDGIFEFFVSGSAVWLLAVLNP